MLHELIKEHGIEGAQAKLREELRDNGFVDQAETIRIVSIETNKEIP